MTKSKLFAAVAAMVLFGGTPAQAAAPVAADDSYSVIAGTTFTVAAPGVLANDTGVPAGTGVHWQTLPPAGLTLNTDGSITYEVPKAASGTATFTYCVLDLPGSPQAQCVSNTATVTIHIAAPNAVDDSYEVEAGTMFTVAAPGVLANDTNIVPGAIVQWQTLPPAGFTLHSDGGLDYQVPADATGTSTFTYCVLDLPGSPQAKCLSNLATVTVRTRTAASPSVPPPADGGTLPKTGPKVSVVAFAGLIMMAAGGAVLLLARRHREKSVTP